MFKEKNKSSNIPGLKKMNNRVQHKEDLTPGLEVWQKGSFRVIKLPSSLYQVERFFGGNLGWVARNQAFYTPIDCMNYVVEVLERENGLYRKETTKLKQLVEIISQALNDWRKS